jgi:hypothetical protein
VVGADDPVLEASGDPGVLVDVAPGEAVEPVSVVVAEAVVGVADGAAVADAVGFGVF